MVKSLINLSIFGTRIGFLVMRVILIIGVGFHGEDLAGQLRKVDPNESGSLDHFSFLVCYVELFDGPDGNKLEEEVSLEYT